MRFPLSTTRRPSRASLIAVLALTLGAALLVISVVGLTRGVDQANRTAQSTGIAAADPLSRAIAAAQERLRNNPEDATTWAQLGSAYVQQARNTADPSYYGKAQGALDRSMELQPKDNAAAMTGLGALANARHDFAAGRDWALRARDVAPETAAVYGVLNDALTQLGDAEGATVAVQRMLDTRPGIPALTRASYDLELHGRVEDARYALDRAMNDAISAPDIAFIRYYLGELAFNSGDVDEAEKQYDAGLVVAPNDVYLLQGRAKAAAARGETEQALADYQTVTNRVPLPQFLQEYGELLLVSGRAEEAQIQFTLFTEQQRLYESEGATDYLTRAVFAADHGDPAEALRYAEAEWQRRQSVFSADAMAWALHVNGRDAEALTYADRALALGWRNALFTYHRGMIQKSLGMRAAAQGQLGEALAINPNFSPLHEPRARAALTELRNTP